MWASCMLRQPWYFLLVLLAVGMEAHGRPLQLNPYVMAAGDQFPLPPSVVTFAIDHSSGRVIFFYPLFSAFYLYRRTVRTEAHRYPTQTQLI
jgi:hypothetical protein